MNLSNQLGIKKPAGNFIEMFFHCKKCINEKPKDISPRDWIRNEVGWTIKGLQVWCVRHEENIINLDFKGQKMGTLP